MSLLIYDFEFNLLTAEHRILSSKWNIFHNEVGSFEAHLPLDSELIRVVTENKYLVAVQKGFSAIIVGKELRDELILYGRTCNWLLSKRITPETAAVTGYAGEIAAGLVRKAFSDVKNFTIDACAGSETEFECGEKLTFNAVAECLKKADMGHEVCFDRTEKKWIFKTHCGRETDLVLSEAHRNAYETACALDILDLATCGRYSLYSEEDGYVRTNIEGDISAVGIYRWETMLDGNTALEAEDDLRGKCERNEISIKVRDTEFGKDYALGDIVRVQVIKGAYRTTVKRRITGVQIYYAQGEYYEQPLLESV